MKFYHGSPDKLKVLKPKKAKGIDDFQNQRAIFLTKDFKQAALYALAKSLKRKTKFALPPGKIIIVGKFEPVEKGYVYEIELNESDVKKGNLEDYEYAYFKDINYFKIHKVNLKDYIHLIEYVDSFDELKKVVWSYKNET